MAKNDNKVIASIVISVIGAFAIGGALTSWFHNDILTIIGVLVGLSLGFVFHKLS